jgi:TonB family protein
MTRHWPCAVLILLTTGLEVSGQQQVPPRDPLTQTNEAARLERDFQARIAAEGLTVSLALELSRIQENRGAPERAEATLLAARSAFPADVSLAHALGAFYNRAGKFTQMMQTMEEAAALKPNDPAGYYLIATYYEEKVRKDFALSDADRIVYVQKGIEATDRALAFNPDHAEALVYKNILLRHQMKLEPDPARRQILQQQADYLRGRAMEIAKSRALNKSSDSSGAAPPPPPPAGRPCGEGTVATIGTPLRVGGGIKAPAKIRDVRPFYPPEAMSAKIQGVVIIEATLAEDGTVAAACVLRSVPYLDDAAVEAVRQWAFRPTLLNGMPVPVIMTVTVNFVLQ